MSKYKIGKTVWYCEFSRDNFYNNIKIEITRAIVVAYGLNDEELLIKLDDGNTIKAFTNQIELYKSDALYVAKEFMEDWEYSEENSLTIISNAGNAINVRIED
jgi:hypothetical protein